MENTNDLNDELGKAYEYYNKQLAFFKIQIDEELNQAIAQHIKYAEKEMEKAKKHHDEEYAKSMESINERKKTAKPDSFLIAREEKMIKKIYKDGLQFSVDIWINFINTCRENLK